MAFKSNDRTFEKVYGIFDKRDYFNAQGLAKTQIGNFERALQRNDKGAQQILDKFKGDMGKAKDYITQVITDRRKEQAFNDYKAFKVAVDSIQKGKPQYGAVDLVKSRIHNSSQKYTIALYSALRNKKFTKWKDVHNDVDSLIGESVNEGQKRYNQKDGVGKSKYVISYHDGKKKHKDGSDFFDIQIFRNKKDLAKFVNTLHKGGYKYGFDESVNEESYKVAGRPVTLIKGKKSNGTDWKVKFQNGKETSLGDVLSLIKPFPKGIKESVNEGKFKPSQVRSAISKVKKGLMRKWKQKGGYENFGQKELRQLQNKFDYNAYGDKDEREISHMLDAFDNWAMNYDGNMRENINESKTKESKVIQKIHTYTKTEKKFYDELAKHEVRIGQRDYAKFIINALRGFGINPREFKRIPDAEEKLYQIVSK